MSRTNSPEKGSPSTSAKGVCTFCFSHLSQCRCSPYKVTAHRLQTKQVPELEHDLREAAARIKDQQEQIWSLTGQLHAANHKYDDVTQPLIAKVEDLNEIVKKLQDGIAFRDKKIAALIREHWAEKKLAQEQISQLTDLNETLSMNIKKLGKYDIGQAAKRSDIDLVSLWISVGCDVNKRDHEQWTPLHWASGSGRSDIADLLIKNKADIHARDDDRWAPIHWAASGGHLDLVKLLLSNQADVNSRCKDLHTPMHWASAMGHANVAEFLHQHGGTLAEDITVLESRRRPRMKEHEASNISGIGCSKFEVCPEGSVRLSFLLPENRENEQSRPAFETSANNGRSWTVIPTTNSDHESWGGKLYLSDPIIITRDLVRCVYLGQIYGPRLLPHERL